MRIPNPEQPHAQLTPTTSAATLAALGYTYDPETAMVLLQCNGGVVRFTVNGTDPTTTLGFALNDGDFVELHIDEAKLAEFIKVSGTPVLEVGAYVLS
jgi:hypothetical protein